MAIKQCKTCSAEINTLGHQIYCDDCRYINCKTCHKRFLCKPAEGRSYCSKKCTRGWKLSPETAKRIGDGHKGRKTGKFVLCTYCKKESYKYPRTLRCDWKVMFCNKDCYYAWTRTSNNPVWKGDAVPENRRLRSSGQYKRWRRTIWKKDNYTCQICRIRGGKLTADHIKSWAMHPELRFELSNGRTLCRDCHRKTDTWGIKAKFQEIYAKQMACPLGLKGVKYIS